jgi:uncharacterized protein YecT (DUF1311 family)
MNIKMQISKNIILSLIIIAMLTGCAALPVKIIARGYEAGESTESKDAKAHQELNQKDCYAIGILSQRESCLALTKSECAKGDSKCELYKNMYLADKKLLATLEEIETLINQIYKSYLNDDPDYINDAVLNLRQSGQSWRKYRDSDCLLEQYANGMSRGEINDLAEVCRLNKTKKRIIELEKIVIVLESNRGS